jgi:hypothetical protein
VRPAAWRSIAFWLRAEDHFTARAANTAFHIAVSAVGFQRGIQTA